MCVGGESSRPARHGCPARLHTRGTPTRNYPSLLRLVEGGTSEKYSTESALRYLGFAADSSTMLEARRAHWPPSAVSARMNVPCGNRGMDSAVVIGERDGDAAADEVLNLGVVSGGIFGIAVENEAHAISQIEIGQELELLSGEVERGELGRGDKEDLLRFVHDLEGELLHVAGQVGTDHSVSAAKIVEQAAQMEHLEAGLRIQCTGMHDVERSEAGDQLGPEVLVNLLGLLARVEHREAVAQLKHEADESAIEVEIAEKDTRVVSLGEGHRGIDGERGGARAPGLAGGQEREEQITAAQTNRVGGQERADPRQAVHHLGAFKRRVEELLNAETHDFEEHLGIAMVVNGDQAYAGSLRLQRFDQLRDGRYGLDADKDQLGGRKCGAAG